jgi:hypothetical protein
MRRDRRDKHGIIAGVGVAIPDITARDLVQPLAVQWLALNGGLFFLRRGFFFVRGELIFVCRDSQ